MEIAPVSSETTTATASDSSVAKDHSAIVQRGLCMKDDQDQLDRKLAVYDDACFFVNPNRCVALDSDERAELLICQLRHRLRQIVDGLSFLTRQRENRVTAERSQPTPKFRLKNHHQRNGKENREASHEPTDHNKIQQCRN